MTYAQEKIKPYNGTDEKGKQVEQMFDGIAPAYDRLNRLLSFGIDRYWRRLAVDALKPFRPETLLDVATGTGDFALLANRRLAPRQITGIDLSEGMMQTAREKAAVQGARILFRKEDCMQLSFPADSFEAVTVAYGVRNFADLERGLREMRRVLRPGGHLVILELGTPVCFPLKQLFGLYARHLMPLVGRLVSKDQQAYAYLPASVKAFPQGEVIQEALVRTGFREASFRRLTFGLNTLFIATK